VRTAGRGSGELRRRRFGEGERKSEEMRASSGRERELGPVPYIGRGEEREREGGSNGASVLQAPSMAAFNGGENVGRERERCAAVSGSGNERAQTPRASAGRGTHLAVAQPGEKKEKAPGGPRLP
jgi:hypothetical protein